MFPFVLSVVRLHQEAEQACALAILPAGQFKTVWNMLIAVCVLHDLMLGVVFIGPQHPV